jgi:hypothetical protein
MHSGETFEFDNLAADPAHSTTVGALHSLLVASLKTALVPPVSTLPLETTHSPPPPSPALDCAALVATNMDLHCPAMPV